MKRVLIILAIILILAGIGALGYAFFFNKAEPVGPSNTNPFGFQGGSDIVPAARLTVALQDGSTRYVPDFTKETQPEWASPDNGYQAGGSDDGDYHIIYFPETTSFLVSLLAEPLGSSRYAAEDELKTKLLMSEDELCTLRIRVATSIHVNETYAGRNLGLSFCPDAVVLP